MPAAKPFTAPLLYQVNTRQWLADLSASKGREIDLHSVPDTLLDTWEQRSFSHVWLMGVWPTGPLSRAEALRHPDLRRAYDEALPGWSDVDVTGSPYAVGAYHVSPLLGGDDGLAALRARLAERGMRVIVDLVPNHTGLDHSWVRTRPELYVSADPGAALPDSVELTTGRGKRRFAHGRDPFFPGWTDTAQLDYRKQVTRDVMRETLLSIADRSDGVRCDMAMLLLNDVFERTWAHAPVDADAVRAAGGEFWCDAIAAVKARHPGFVFIAEAYWHKETPLVQAGFDYAYDKELYDRLVHHRPWDVQPHLLGLGDQVQHRAFFLENHDEPRVAAHLSLAEHKAAALTVLSLPGLRFLHDGQLEGRRTFARVQLARRLDEPADLDTCALYGQLFEALQQTQIGRGSGRLLAPRRAWSENGSAQCFTLIEWHHDDTPDRFELVVVNHAPHRAQCYAPLDLPGLAGGTWRLTDLLGHEVWERAGNELLTRGLYLDVDAHQAQLFRVQRLG